MPPGDTRRVMGDWQVERLDPTHERGGFSCGKPALDEFLRNLVRQYEKRNLGRTYAAVSPGEKRVLGYYTLAAGSIAFEKVPTSGSRKLPKYPVPVVLLARLAVDRSVQGRGLGATLLTDALARSLSLADEVGLHAVEVDAIDDDAKSFSEKYGFVPLLDAPRHLYLTIATIRKAFSEK